MANETAETIGDLIREIRRGAGHSQESLAALMHCSQRAVARMEHAGDRVPITKLVRAARALGVRIRVTIETVHDEKAS